MRATKTRGVKKRVWGGEMAQCVRVLALQARGPEFKSPTSKKSHSWLCMPAIPTSMIQEGHQLAQQKQGL